MLSKISEATNYICDAIKNLKQEEILPEVVEDILEEKLYEKIEPLLTENDLQILSKNEDDDNFAENYMIQKVPNYINLLEQVTKEILTDYITETE